MRYRLTVLTPTLVGDGRSLSPIDYMVWKDHVNVLDQWRIFRLLAKGPRLEAYLEQLKKSEKLDFASWGGFAVPGSDVILTAGELLASKSDGSHAGGSHFGDNTARSHRRRCRGCAERRRSA